MLLADTDRAISRPAEPFVQGRAPGSRSIDLTAGRATVVAKVSGVDDRRNPRRANPILALAARDMQEVIAACDALAEAEPGPLRGGASRRRSRSRTRAAFSASNTRGPLGGRWQPRAGTPERELHDWLLGERHRRYAHTDSDGGRIVLHKGSLETGWDGLVTIQLPYPRDRLPSIQALATDLGSASGRPPLRCSNGSRTSCGRRRGRARRCRAVHLPPGRARGRRSGFDDDRDLGDAVLGRPPAAQTIARRPDREVLPAEPDRRLDIPRARHGRPERRVRMDGISGNPSGRRSSWRGLRMTTCPGTAEGLWSGT